MRAEEEGCLTRQGQTSSCEGGAGVWLGRLKGKEEGGGGGWKGPVRRMEKGWGERRGEGGEIRKEKEGEMFFLSAVLRSRTST